MTNQSGTYFRDIYANLVKELPEFPSNDPSPNLQDCINEKYTYVDPQGNKSERYGLNFVRAEMLARQHKLPSDVVTHLREMAILQYVIDFKNAPGLQKVVSEFGLSATEIGRIAGLIAQEKEYPCFSFSKNTELAIDENWAPRWHTEYLPIIEQLVKVKPSVLSRFIGWVKRLFVRKST